ncbi:MAG: purine-binding chemotaxis protein CheW [Brevinematales bacterium]|nr:purine-binding chemotaxis protein CheW [Brevinematales bacterium]
MADNATKYLVFNINDEDYGVPISKIREVIRFVKITPIHEASDFLKGVINLRGKIIPIIDMRAKFGMQEQDYSDRTVFIIVDIMGAKEVFNLGMSVDAVQDVVSIKEEDVEKTPDIGLRLKSQYLDGIAKVGEHMIMMLNMDKILGSDEVVEIREFNEKHLDVQEAKAI